MRLLAFDLGAESGRGMLGTWDGSRLAIEELGRFPTGGYESGGSRLWDVDRMFGEMQKMLDGAGDLSGIGVDTWGVDYGLIYACGRLISPPYHYRDHRTDGLIEQTRATVSDEEFYSITGIQFMQFNTVYQLIAQRRDNPDALDSADRLLMMPDILNFLLCGEKVNELTIASTSQLLDAQTREWSKDLADKLNIPLHLMGTPVAPGTRIGQTKGGVPVLTVGCHDTGSAVAAVCGEGDNWCYLSSGTWSIVGAELTSPILNADALHANFTNEAGVEGTIRFLKNIFGLWLVQECRRMWTAAGHTTDYATLAEDARRSTYAGTFDVTDPGLLAPANMVETIHDLLRAGGHPMPSTYGDTVRACLASLAASYVKTFQDLERLTGRKYDTIHIVGGGSKNTLLDQLTADACGVRVIAGPSEATAIGNLLAQLIGLGELANLAQARDVVRRSFADELVEYTPRSGDQA